MRGFDMAEAGHPAWVIYPEHAAGSVTSKPVHGGKAHRVQFLLSFGVTDAAPTTVKVHCSALSDLAAKTAVAFGVYKEEVGDTDVLGARVEAVAADGFVPPGTDKVSYVIDVDPASLTDGKPWISVEIDSASSQAFFIACAAVMNLRQQSAEAPTVLA